MDQGTALLWSYLFVFLVIGTATALQKIWHLSADFSRKFVHIGVGNWGFLAIFLFQDWHIAIIPPISFILINYLSYRFTVIKAMELEEKNPGTIYFAVSLAILTFCTFYSQPARIFPYTGLIVMTWGDGMAAVIGQKWPLRRLKANKSVSGVLAFVVFATAALFVYFMLVSAFTVPTALLIAFGIAVAGAVIEYFSPGHTDNLTVPLFIGLAGWLIEIF